MSEINKVTLENINSGDTTPTSLVQFNEFKLSNREFLDDRYKSLSKDTNNSGLSGLDNFNKISTKILERAKIQQNGETVLTGNYQENKVYFPLYDISKITPVSNININFILKINSPIKSGQGVGNKYKLFTSNKVYETLVNAYNRNIPYLALSKIVDIVEINLSTLIDVIKAQKPEEDAANVEINNNLGIVYDNVRNDYNVNDYDTLLRYIDWVVTKPGLDYDNRLINVNEISDVELLLEVPEPPSNETTAETTTPTYPPIGRYGSFNGETVTLNGLPYIWSSLLEQWNPDPAGFNGTGSGNQGGSGNQNDLPGRS